MTIENWVEDEAAKSDAINGNNLYGEHGAKMDGLSEAQSNFIEGVSYCVKDSAQHSLPPPFDVSPI